MNKLFSREKIYLHLDRSSYWASDDIWFKAYLKDSPIAECNLYVELFNSSETVVQKKIYWAQGGLAYGDMHLTDTISSGVYQIRAYTNWMRNFDDQWFFRKDLVIMNLRDHQTDTESNRLKERKIDFQFFPEVGTFIAGLKNKVAFKVADQNGKGLEVEGKVVDDLGNVVVDLKSNFKGIGSFVIQPKEGRKYTAHVTIAGEITLDIDLPDSHKEGVMLTIDPNDSIVIHAQISGKSLSTETNLNGEFYLIEQVNGLVCYQVNVKMKNGVCNLAIWKDAFPNGIVQFTLFDYDALPVCERLVFVNHHDNVTVKIDTDQKSYPTRDKVLLHVTAMKGKTPLVANLSMSVYNPETQIGMEHYPGNILTHLLLSSELKGLIEDPVFYFKDDSLSTLHALDNLMLTHGYRHFDWKQIQEDKYPRIAYPAEECIKIRGIVKSIIMGKSVPECRVTLVSVKGLFRFYQVSTDSLGQFLFSNLYFNESSQFSLQAINKKGKRNTWIEMDTSSFVSPQVSYLPIAYQYSPKDPVNATSYLSDVNNELLKRKWHLSDTILLIDINIVKHQIKKGDGHIRMYGEPDYVLDVAKEDDVYANIFDMLEASPKTRRFIGGAVFLDGVPATRELINSIPASGFDKVEVVKFSPLIKGGGPGLFFYLKRGGPEKYVPIDAQGMRSAKVMGYSVIRKFYSPRYYTQLPIEIKKDFRSTLYWNPIVRTDSLGKASVFHFTIVTRQERCRWWLKG